MASLELERVEVLDAAGRPFLIARVPRIERRFRSAMHDGTAMVAQMGGWRAELGAVLSRRLPVGILTHHGANPQEMADVRREVIGALRAGLAGGVSVNADGEITGRVALTDRIADTVDLQALANDLTAWLQAAGAYDAEDDRAEIAYAIEELSYGTYADYLWTVGELGYGLAASIQQGIVTGKDPATTVAFQLKERTGETRFWESLR